MGDKLGINAWHDYMTVCRTFPHNIKPSQNYKGFKSLFSDVISSWPFMYILLYFEWRSHLYVSLSNCSTISSFYCEGVLWCPPYFKSFILTSLLICDVENTRCSAVKDQKKYIWVYASFFIFLPHGAKHNYRNFEILYL